MTKRNRRQFMSQSMAAAAAVAAGSTSELLAGACAQSSSPNERLGVAIVGARGRGGSHIGVLAGRRDAQILYICDVDREVGYRRVAEAAKRQGGFRPHYAEDLRQVLDDSRVDVVTIATPNHWHALGAIWCMQAGKDVYLECPVSHNVLEGRCIAQTARRHRRICQAGSQSRSNPAIQEAVGYLREERLGRVLAARGLCRQRCRSMGHPNVYPTPRSVNYDMWLGPAPAAPLTRRQLHHDWHWQWPYGNGNLGSHAIHHLDLARWGLGKQEMSERVLSCGIRFAPHDAGDAADLQAVVHDYGDTRLVLEAYHLQSGAPRRPTASVTFEASEGCLILVGLRGGAAFDANGRLKQEFRGGRSNHLHIDNFLAAVRSRVLQDLNADIEEGHLSSCLCHTGNISYRLGDNVSFTQASDRLTDSALSQEAQQALEHLAAYGASSDADLQHTPVVWGQELEFNPAAEEFINNQPANALLTRQYRQSFEIPSISGA